MHTRQRKLWHGVGSALLVASGSPELSAAEPVIPQPPVSAAAADSATAAPGRGGEAYRNNGGPGDVRVRYIRSLTLLTGHILIADEWVAAGRFDEAADQLREPTVEPRAHLAPYLPRHRFAPIDPAIEAAIAALEAGDPEAYRRARRSLDRRLRDADALIRKFSVPHHRFAIRGLVETLKAASGAYAGAFGDDRITEAADYREGRGAVRAVAAALAVLRPALDKANSAARAAIDNEMRQVLLAWPSLQPPLAAVVAPEILAAQVARIDDLSQTF